MSEVIEMRSRGGRNLARLLRQTSAETPLNVLARLFLLGVPVHVKCVRSVMTSVRLEEWCNAGLLYLDSEHVKALVAISPFEGLLLASEKPELLDRGAEPDYVCSITNSTATISHFMLRRPFDHVLDLCTGCGALAFLSARQSRNVFATDLNPRAIALAAFNARLNNLDNIRFATGSAFEPASGQKFDLITANPPCVIGPSAKYHFRDSGLELDAFCRQLLAEAPEYLMEGGIFQCTLEWPNIGGAEWRKRILQHLQNLHCDALVLHVRTEDAQMHAEETVFDTDVLDIQEQSRLFNTYIDYFRERNVTSISEGLVALRRRSGGHNWIRLENLPIRSRTPFGDAVFEYFGNSDAIERLGNSLLDLKLRMAPSITVGTSRTWNGQAWEDGSYGIRQGLGFEFDASVDISIANLIRRCEGDKTLRELVADLAEDANVPFESIAGGCLRVITSMLQKGFLILPKGLQG
jgi:hypothetical protein